MQKQDIKAYCGECNIKLKVPDNFTAPTGKCPRCGGVVVNPKGELRKKNDEYYFKDRFTASRFLGIRYDELSCFLLSSAVLITIIFNFDVIAGWCSKFFHVLMTGSASRPLSSISLWEYLKSVFGIIGVFIGGIFFIVTYTAGFLYSFYHVFTRKSKSEDRFFMVTFAVFTNSISGFAAAYSMHAEKLWPEKWYLGIFPLWVWCNSIFLLCVLCQSTESSDDTKKFEEILADDDATTVQVLFALIILLAVLGFSHYVFKLNWAITFCVSVAYATAFSKAFREIFPNRTPVSITKTNE